MDNIITLLASSMGLIGIVITAILGYRYFRKQEEDKISITFFIEYEKRAQELAIILQDLLTLTFVPSNYSDEQLDEISKKLSLFYFKYYLTLPAPVLCEIQCLFSCIHYRGKYLFTAVQEESGIYRLKRLGRKKEYELLMKDSSILFKHDEDVIRRYYQTHKDRLPDNYIKFQARHAITVIHDSWNISNIHEWKECLTKITLAKKD